MFIRKASSRTVFSPDKMGKADLILTDSLFVGLNCFEPGQEHRLHTHAGQDKIYLVLEGEGEAVVGEQTERVGPGDLIAAGSGEPHSMRNPGPGRLVVLVTMAPPPRRG